ncbi:uncharacterized protein LOC130645273 [Hydractinia symbiolongicarpus]|uniref:uncharacterized protein LOC130645273 n=1 Tax=Hydractinia symbiolongicarpus TaxID=13093 RepID=UPI00254CDB0F|nr:uncharacterized protein LOC130645273 [Hydractinia symbiolongicarpus]XP_057307197.1 uncharacterized protein LOC130645273 [Hydractinia symbiolongicarpus]XP_057307207.1 uncharacterized protein LOC130645273 [Hydractinia symbiolongicarpus]XP_057307215.1 uncharacterized protein LOC130645273 [Hydractinia symbiolongicarpus]
MRRNSDYQRLLIEDDEAEKRSPITALLKPFLKKDTSPNNDYDLELDQYLPLPNEEASDNDFFVEYVYFPKEIGKRQVRCKGELNQQRLDLTAAKIKLNLMFANPVTIKEILRIELQVHRANSVPNHINLFTGYATLDKDRTRFFQQEAGTNEIVVISDLDSVYTVEGKKVYELSKTTAKYNEFEVLIHVYFHNGAKSSFGTQKFIVVGNKAEQTGIKRHASSPQDDVNDRTLPRSNKYFRDPSLTENFPHVQKLVTDMIEAKQGKFDRIYANTIIKSGNGDIAYHFKLKDQFSNEDFGEGEVIGFTVDRLGHVVIQKLTLHNAKDVFLMGVVTNSQYLECNFKQEGRTATICMLGLVKVKVVGSVYQGEGLYASPDLPGATVSQHHIEKRQQEEHQHALIGHAFQKIECEDNKEHSVQALVSIVDCASHNLMQSKLSGLESRLKVDMSNKFERNKRNSRTRCCCITGLGIFITLLAILLYQITVPGSAYKLWLCRKGSTGTSKYWYWLQGNEFKGVEFGGCEEVWKRAIGRFHNAPKQQHFHQQHQCLNGTFHYYINLDSCAGKINPGARYVFAIDRDCSRVWQFDEKLGSWKRDEKVCSTPKCNVKCSFTSTTAPSTETCDIDESCKRDTLNNTSKSKVKQGENSLNKM